MQHSINDHSHSDKIRLAAEGRKLNPTIVENDARLRYGKRKYMDELRIIFNVTYQQIWNAFNGNAPYLLHQISLRIIAEDNITSQAS